MVDLLLSLPGPLAVAVAVTLSVAVVLAGYAGVRRVYRNEDLRAGNEVSGLLYGVLGGVYGIVLAFVLVAVWEDFGEAQQHVEAEVTALGTLHRDAAVFPEPARTELRAALGGYVRSVVDEEWAALGEGRTSPRTAAAYDRVWQAIYDLDPGDGRTAVFYEQAVDRLGEVGENRGSRILAAKSGIPPTLWLLLGAGAVVVAGMALVLGSEHPATHRASAGALAAVLSTVLFATLALDHPFGAGITLSKQPFVDLTEQWSSLG